MHSSFPTRPSPIRSPSRSRWPRRPSATGPSCYTVVPRRLDRARSPDGLGGVSVCLGRRPFDAGLPINCAGLEADSIARLVGTSRSRSIRGKESSSCSIRPRASDSNGSCSRSRPSEREVCSCSRRSTARSSRDRRRSIWRTRATGRCAPTAREEIVSKAAPLYPPLADAEPVFAYAGLRPAGRGANYVIGSSPACPRLMQRRRDSLDRAERVTRDRGARHRDRPFAGSPARARGTAPRRPAAGGRWSLVAPDGRLSRTADGMTLLLGIDEGTSAVKAVLYDADLRPLAQARREKRLVLPAGRLGGAGPRRGA